MSQDPMLEIRNSYLRLVAQTSTDDFKPMPTGAPLQDKAYLASLRWCGRVFRIPVHQPGDKVEHAYHIGHPEAPADFFRHLLVVGSVSVRVYEASSFFAIFVPAASFSAINPADKSAQAVALLTAVKAPPTFRLILGDPAQRAYSTDPDRSAPRLGDWTRRIDVVVLDTELAIIIYKATFDDMMTQVSNPAAWFEDLRHSK